MPRGKKHTHCVYVIELDPRVWRERATMRKANPRYSPLTGLGFVYVGMTSHTPEERFAIHKKGGELSAPVVRRFGRALQPRLYQAYERMSRPDAEEMERYLADRLRRKGYAVWPVKPGGAFTMDGGPPARRPVVPLQGSVAAGRRGRRRTWRANGR
jgi:hypothetical protein